MAFKDPEKQREYQRAWVAKRRETAPGPTPRKRNAETVLEYNRRWKQENRARHLANERSRAAKRRKRPEFKKVHARMERIRKDVMRHGEFAEVARLARLLSRQLKKEGK